MEQQIFENVKLIISSIGQISGAEEYEISEKTAKIYSEKLREAEKEIKEKYENALEYELNALKIEANKKISEFETHKKAALSKIRSEITEDVFNLVEEKMQRFTSCPEYDSFLFMTVKNLSSLYDGAAVIFVSERDMENREKINGAFGKPCEIKIDKSIKFGGVKVLFADYFVIADETLDGRFENEKKSFIKNCRLGFRR